MFRWLILFSFSFSALAIDCRGPAFEAVAEMTKVNFPESYEAFDYGLQSRKDLGAGKQFFLINAIAETKTGLVIEAFSVIAEASNNACSILDIKVETK